MPSATEASAVTVPCRHGTPREHGHHSDDAIFDDQRISGERADVLSSQPFRIATFGSCSTSL